MVVKEYIGKFEKYGLGMFVHFGPYSVMGKGEWIKKIAAVPFAYEIHHAGGKTRGAWFIDAELEKGADACTLTITF